MGCRVEVVHRLIGLGRVKPLQATRSLVTLGPWSLRRNNHFRLLRLRAASLGAPPGDTYVKIPTPHTPMPVQNRRIAVAEPYGVAGIGSPPRLLRSVRKVSILHGRRPQGAYTLLLLCKLPAEGDAEEFVAAWRHKYLSPRTTSAYSKGPWT